MKSAEIKLLNRSGLHARPAARFVQIASKFNSIIMVCKGGRCVNAKNILQILALGIDFGDVIEIRVSGNDEEFAFNELLNLLTKILPEEDR